jgi:hypothetical protein
MFTQHLLGVAMKSITGLFLLLVLALALYGAGLQATYFSDDYQFVFDPSSTVRNPLEFFYSNISGNDFYRPFQVGFLWVVQHYAGMNTLPIHLVQVGLHAVLCWLLLRILLALGFSRIQALLGALFMLVSQANVVAVISNDTISQSASALLGYLSVWLLYRHGTAAPGTRRLEYFFALVALSIAYFLKESAIAFFLLTTSTLFLLGYQEGGRTGWLRMARRAVPVILVTGAYLLIRAQFAGIQPSIGESGYTFQLGFNVVKNVAMLLFSAILPFSSVSTFVLLKSREYTVLLPIFACALFFFATVATGLWLSRKRAALLWIIGGMALLSLFPVILLPHVSELYAYNATPALYALLGIGLGRALEASSGSRALRFGVAVILVSALVSHVIAVQQKVALMRDNGVRANNLYTQITPFLARVPEQGELILLNTPNPQIEYSVFLMKDFNVLEFGNLRFAQLAGRSDFSVSIAQTASLLPTKGRQLVLTLDSRGTVREINPTKTTRDF